MGTLTWIITGSVLGVLIINKLVNNWLKIKELEERVEEWKNITRRCEDAYRQEAKSSRGYKEVAEEAVEVGVELAAEYRELSRRYNQVAKLAGMMGDKLFNGEK